MSLHPRTTPVQRASVEIQQACLELMVKHDLTFAEQVGIYAEMLASAAKYARRDERHPNDPDKYGDEA
jgi:hypothetical protein